MKRGIAKAFRTGRSQTVRIPKEYRFACDEVFIERQGERIILTPKPRTWKEYFATRASLPADYPEKLLDEPPEDVESR